MVKNKVNSLQKLLLWTAIIILINVIGQYLYFRWDLTTEKRYSLSEPTVKMLEKNEDEVYIKVYLAGDNLPAGFKRLQQNIQDLLKEFSRHSSLKVRYEFVDPFAGITDEQEKNTIYTEMVEKGLAPTNLKVQKEQGYEEQIIFPGALVNVGDRQYPISLLENQLGYNPEEALNHSIILLEYKFSNAIKKLSMRRNPTLLFVEGHGEYGNEDLEDISRSLQAGMYRTGRINLKATKATENGDSVSVQIPPNTDVLVIARPLHAFDEREKFKIDQYIMQGGRVLWLIESTTASLDSLRTQNIQIAGPVETNLDDMLFRYGVRVEKNLVQDAQMCNPIALTPPNASQPQLFPWFFFPLLQGNNNHPVSRNLDPIAAYFAGSIDTIKAVQNIKKTALLTTTRYSRAYPEPVRIHFGIIREKTDYKYFKQPYLPVAYVLEGTFTSAFKNRLDYVFAQKLEQNGVKVLEQSKPTRQIVIADGDIIRNETDSRGNPLPLGYNRFSQMTSANKDFITNCIDYLTDEDGLAFTRNKEVKLRMLDKKKISKEKIQWQMLNVLLPLVLVGIFAFIFQWRRRKKYTQS
jgi:ABC-2 type transport system permease protein